MYLRDCDAIFALIFLFFIRMTSFWNIVGGMGASLCIPSFEKIRQILPPEILLLPLFCLLFLRQSLFLKTRCQLKWKMQGQNHQFSKCYFFHIQSFQSLFICINRWYLIFFYKIFNVEVIWGPESFLPFLPFYLENGYFWAKNGPKRAF